MFKTKVKPQAAGSGLTAKFWRLWKSVKCRSVFSWWPFTSATKKNNLLSAAHFGWCGQHCYSTGKQNNRVEVMACQYWMSAQIFEWPDTLPGRFIHFIWKIKFLFLVRLDIFAIREGKKGKRKKTTTQKFYIMYQFYEMIVLEGLTGLRWLDSDSNGWLCGQKRVDSVQANIGLTGQIDQCQPDNFIISSPE